MAARGDGERRALSALEQRQLSAAYLLLLPLAELHQLPQHVLGDASECGQENWSTVPL